MKTIPLLAIALALATTPLAFAAQPPAATTTADATALATANNAFACDLYAQLKGDDSGARENLFFSPFSVSSALAMACAGAKGDTAAQMQKALHFSDAQKNKNTNANVHASFAALLKHFDDVQRAGTVQLAIANSLWPQKDARTPLLKSYLALVKQNYGVKITPVDFVRAEPKARAQINRWVAEKTHGKIQDIIGNPIDPLTRLVLVNAVYFKGTWENIFKPDSTKEEPFFIWDAPAVQSPLMRQTKSYSYGKQPDAQFIEMPYKGGNVSMFVILPESISKEGLARVEKQLSPEQIALWRNQMKKQEVEIYLPKFKINWGAKSLVNPLKKLGMLDAFVEEQADFSDMNGNKEFSISDILQKAFVDVNEEGTEAAAATTIAVACSGIMPLPPPPPIFRADHPFLFFIQDNATGSILFMGRVVNPAAQ